MIKEGPFIILLVVVDKSRSREIIVLLNRTRATIVLSCSTGPTLYLKELCLRKSLSCPLLYLAIPAWPNKIESA